VDPEISSLFLIGRLVKNGPTRAKDLAGAICADQSTVSRQVAALVKAELIERLADPDDGRASLLRPTALGVARLEKHFANRGQALAPLTADWSDDERRQFVELLDRFTTSLESRRDDVAKTMTRSHSASASDTDVPPTASTERSH
jgi:DNA-binding MarR family transcriptional regulator